MTSMIRNLMLMLTLGFFLSAATAQACDGDKGACKAHGTKTAMKDCKDKACMKDGKCTMTKAEMKKSGCCAAHAKSGKAMSMKSMKDCPMGATGKHDCCKAKASADKS